MPLFSNVELGNGNVLIRVPGGWIYEKYALDQKGIGRTVTTFICAVFIPYSEDFKFDADKKKGPVIPASCQHIRITPEERKASEYFEGNAAFRDFVKQRTVTEIAQLENEAKRFFEWLPDSVAHCEIEISLASGKKKKLYTKEAGAPTLEMIQYYVFSRLNDELAK